MDKSNASLIYGANEAALLAWLDDCDGSVDFMAFADECDRIAHVVAQASGVGRTPIGLVGTGVLMLDFAASLVGAFVDPRVAAANVPGAERFQRLCSGEVAA